MGDFDDFLVGCATECVNAHVRPEPAEALPRRRWGLAEHYAAIKAWQALDTRRVSFEDVKLAVETFLDSIEGQKGRP